MITVRGSLLPQFGGGLFKATPGVTQPDEIIDGFPEFAFTTSDPLVEQKLRALAKRIVASHNAGRRRIIGFEVHGHADKTLRPPPGQSAEQTELEVSRDRAENARDLLLKFIEEEGGKPIIAGIRANAEATGFGSKHRIFIPANNEAQMKKNRRVEIFLKEFEPPPPRPSPPDPPPKPPEPGTRWRIQIKRAKVLSANIPIPRVPVIAPGAGTIDIDIEITDLLRKKKATYNAQVVTVSIVGGIITSEEFRAGPVRDFSTTNGVTLERFAGSVFVGKNGDSISNAKTAGFFFFDFDALSPEFTIPKVLEVKPGSAVTNNVLPDPSPGLAPVTGTLTMVGSVVTVE